MGTRALCVLVGIGYLAVVALAVAPQPARAAATVIAHSPSDYNAPVLSGDRVLAQLSRGSHTVELQSLAPGAKPALLARVRSKLDFLARFSYGGGGGRLAASAVELGRVRFLGGPASGPLAALASCNPADVESQPFHADADGALAAWSDAGCAAGAIRIDDGAATRTVTDPGFNQGLAVAGRRVAWVTLDSQQQNWLTVWNADTASAVYRVRVPFPQFGFALRPDGAVAIASNVVAESVPGATPCGQRLWGVVQLYTPAAPTSPQALPLATCNGGLAMAGDRIAYVRELGKGRTELTVSNLDGGAAVPVARFNRLDFPAGFDFDGARIAWGQRRCRDSALLVRDASDTSPPVPPASCPVRLGRRVALHRDGSLHARISCPHGCRSGSRPYGLQIVSPHWLHVRSRSHGITRYTPAARFSLKPGGHATLRIPLTKRQVRTLRRHRHARARFKVTGRQIYRPRIMRTVRAG